MATAWTSHRRAGNDTTIAVDSDFRDRWRVSLEAISQGQDPWTSQDRGGARRHLADHDVNGALYDRHYQLQFEVNAFDLASATRLALAEWAHLSESVPLPAWPIRRFVLRSVWQSGSRTHSA